MQPTLMACVLTTNQKQKSRQPLLAAEYHDMLKYQEYQHHGRCTCGVEHPIYDKFGTPRKAMRSKVLFIATVLTTFLLICSLIFTLFPKNNVHRVRFKQINTLKLVNLFNRHGDRAPSDRLPLHDKHALRVNLFWPNGLQNLTEVGKLREFTLGQETRRHYGNFLDYNSSSVLAFSSEVYRCRESLKHFLRGFYDISMTASDSLAFFDKCDGQGKCKLPVGSGSPAEWEKIKINYEGYPGLSLSYKLQNTCKYTVDHKSPVDSDLLASENIRALKGVEKYKKLLKTRYNQDFDFDALTIWNVVKAELSIARTNSTLEYADHFRDWIHLEASSSQSSSSSSSSVKKPENTITMFDLAEEICVLAYRDRLVGLNRRIQLGPIIESLIESQSMALGYKHDEKEREKKIQMYDGKKLIVYSSHDTILQLLWFTLNLIEADESPFEKRFHKWAKSENDLIRLLHGLKMTEFGHSARFELWEATAVRSGKRFPYVKVSMYNSEALNFHEIRYEPVELGTSCRRMFMNKYPQADPHELARFYESDIELDTKFSCPFHLFRNLTSELVLDSEAVEKLCNPHRGLFDI